MSVVPHRVSQPSLRIWTPDAIESHAGESQPEPLATVPPELNNQLTLSQFFEHWFLPLILVQQKKAAETTIDAYRDAIGWWERLTGDPPLSQIDDHTIGLVEAALRVATYKRGRLGREWPLLEDSQHKIKRCLNAVLHRTGPKTDRRKTAKLLGKYPEGHVCEGEWIEAPYFVLGNLEKSQPKPPFSLKHARLIAAHATQFRWGSKPGKARAPLPPVKCGDWWQAFFSVLYYTGLRVGTVLQLRWEHVEQGTKSAWLNIPKAIVTKTHKGFRKFLHADALFALERIKTGSALLLPSPYCYDYLAKLHKKVQAEAGVPEGKIQSPHAWRRTHATQMCRIGMDRGIKIAQKALDHADDKTTREFYVHQEPMLVRRLPILIPNLRDGADPQLRLFDS